MIQDMGVAASPPGLCPFGVEPAAQSQAEPLVPNAMRFGTVVSIVLAAHGLGADKFTSFAANINYLQRQDAVPWYATGRGRAALYSRDDLFRILFAVELQQAGMTPIQIAPIVNKFADGFSSSIENRLILYITIGRAPGRSIMLAIDTKAIAQAIEARRAETQSGSVEDESAVPQGCAQ